MTTPTAVTALPRLDRTLAFMRTLWRLEHALQSASKRMADRHGVTGPQRLALRMIGACPGIAPAALAEALHLHPSTITGVLQRLESRGLVARRQDARDARRVRLHITRRGRGLGSADASGTVESLVRGVLARVPARDRAVVVRVLGRLAGELGRWVADKPALSNGGQRGAGRKKKPSARMT